MSVVIRLKVPIEMHYTVIPMGTSKVNSSQKRLQYRYIPIRCPMCEVCLVPFLNFSDILIF